MFPGFPADFSEDPDDSKEIARILIELDEKQRGRKLTRKEKHDILVSVTPEVPRKANEGSNS
jgi:hypothetical protein